MYCSGGEYRSEIKGAFMFKIQISTNQKMAVGGWIPENWAMRLEPKNRNRFE